MHLEYIPREKLLVVDIENHHKIEVFMNNLLCSYTGTEVHILWQYSLEKNTLLEYIPW